MDNRKNECVAKPIMLWPLDSCHRHVPTEGLEKRQPSDYLRALLLRNARCLHLLQYGGQTAKPCDRACGSDTFWFTSLTPLISFLPASAVTNCHELGSLKQRKFFCGGSGGQELEVSFTGPQLVRQLGWAPPGGSRGERASLPFPASRGTFLSWLISSVSKANTL